MQIQKHTNSEKNHIVRSMQIQKKTKTRTLTNPEALILPDDLKNLGTLSIAEACA